MQLHAWIFCTRRRTRLKRVLENNGRRETQETQEHKSGIDRKSILLYKKMHYKGQSKRERGSIFVELSACHLWRIRSTRAQSRAAHTRPLSCECVHHRFCRCRYNGERSSRRIEFSSQSKGTGLFDLRLMSTHNRAVI